MKQQEQSCDRLKTKSTPSPLVLGLDWSLTKIILMLELLPNLAIKMCP